MHPIFESVEYPFAIKEAFDFHKTLYTIIPQPQAIDLLYKSCQIGLPPLHNGNANDLWKEALEILATKSLLRTLIQKLRGDNPAEAMLLAIKNVEDAQSVIDALIVADSVLIMDRKPLRLYLDELANDRLLQKVLIVRGEPKSGKTHSNYLFEQVAIEKGGSPIYVSRDQPTLDAVLQVLFTEVGGPNLVPKKDTTGEAWYQVVCNHLNALAITTKKRLWIAVDDLGYDENGVPLSDDEVRNFFNQFALLMKNGSMRRNFRLMLIHYPDTKPSRWDRNLWKEVCVKESDIKKEDIVEAIRYWCKIKEKKILDDEISTQAEAILAKASGPQDPGEEPSPKLQRIYDGVNDFLIPRA